MSVYDKIVDSLHSNIGKTGAQSVEGASVKNV